MDDRFLNLSRLQKMAADVIPMDCQTLALNTEFFLSAFVFYGKGFQAEEIVTQNKTVCRKVDGAKLGNSLRGCRDGCLIYQNDPVFELIKDLLLVI